MTRIAVLLACHNRREKTLACLRALFANSLPGDVRLHAFLVDDGSTDGTSEAVAAEFPQVRIERGDGNLFWNRAMHRAFGRALDVGFDGYLWLNDDTVLYEGAITTILESAQVCADALVVGAVCDERGTLTYGGGRRLRPLLRPFLYALCMPDGTWQDVDVVNGNVFYIPERAARNIGNIDPAFAHGMGDTDFAMRARRAGFRILLAPRFVATCSRNAPAGTYRDASLGFWGRMGHAFSRKGLPPRSWLRMCLKHGGPLWPLHFAWAYVRIAMGRG